MSEQSEANANELEGWPLPSSEVLRDLDPPAVVWSESEAAAGWPLRPTGTG